MYMYKQQGQLDVQRVQIEVNDSQPGDVSHWTLEPTLHVSLVVHGTAKAVGIVVWRATCGQQ